MKLHVFFSFRVFYVVLFISFPCLSQTETDVLIPGSLSVSGGISIERYYKKYDLSVKSGSSDSLDLGKWDMCYLNYVMFAGIDKHRKDEALCSVDIEGDLLPGKLVKQGDYLSWLMRARAREDVDYVTCKAICINLEGNCSGEQCEK